MLAYVEGYHRDAGVAPVMEEVAIALGVSVPRVHALVSRLEREGLLVSLWVSGRRSPRSLRVVAAPQLLLPLE